MDVATAQRLGRLIEREKAEIERRWLEHVQRDVLQAQGVSLTQLRDGIPDYLTAMVKLLLAADLDLLDEHARSSWATVAREHGITRVRIGFDVSQLVHEFIVLRRVIAEIVDREPELAAAKPLIADIVEAAIAAAVQAYVDARDAEGRRTQAESIGFMTHELRNPLVTATLTTARLRSRTSPEHAKLLDSLDRSLGRLNELIDGVLLTQKLEAREVVAQPERVELAPLIESAVEAARKVAEAKRLEFRCVCDARLTALLDRGLTRSAIANLADNAAKYTDAGEVEIQVDDRSDALVINVRDSCPGLSAEELRTIFEPFKRGRSGKAGTGLGLAIARRAVEAQGGKIEAESPGASGCHFWITLPKRS